MYYRRLDMGKTLTARLDERAGRELAKLARALDKTESEIVREGIHLLAMAHLTGPSSKTRFIGLGQFTSGFNDLASNKSHLDDFGK